MQKTAYAIRISDWSSDVCSSDLPGEFRGFEYHTGIAFSLFARNVRGELGRGGRYTTPAGEPATGFTLYLDSVMRALPAQPVPPMVYLPHGTPRSTGAELRRQGHRSEEHTSELQSLMRISYAVFCLKKKKT